MNPFDDIPKINHWLDLENREKFSACIDLKQIKEPQPLKKVIAAYELSPKVYCGIASCHTAHHKGFLVELFDGSETIVGHCCGKKYFGRDFTVEKNRLTKLATDKQNYEIITRFIKNLSVHKNEFNNVFNENELNCGFKKLMLAVIDFNTVRTNISSQTFSNIGYDGEVFQLVRKSDKDIEIERVAGQGQLIETHQKHIIAKINHFNLLFQIDKFYQLKDYFSNLFIFFERHGRGFTSNQLKQYGKLVKDFDNKLHEMKILAKQGSNLLSKTNLEKLNLAIGPHRVSELRLVNAFINRQAIVI